MCGHPKKVPENLFKPNKVFRALLSKQKTATKCVITAAGQIYHHTHLYERRTNAIKLPSRWGFTMCWRSPRTTLWRWRDAAGSLRRNRSGGLKSSVLFFGFFFKSFFHTKTKASSLLLLLEGCMLSHFFCKIGSEAAGATSFLRIDLADCAADQFS